MSSSLNCFSPRKPKKLYVLGTWNGRWRCRRLDGGPSFGNHADPVLVSVAIDVVPPGGGAVVVAHHLHALLAALVVVGLSGAPVGVREGHAVAPGVAYMPEEAACK